MSTAKKMFAHSVTIATVLAVIAGCGSPVDPPVQVPSVPTGVSAAATSETAISLSWNGVEGATGYVVYRNGVAVDTTEQTQFADAALPTCATYSYQVAAMNSGGLSQLSPAVSALIQPQPIPGSGGILLKEPNGCVDFKVGDTMVVTWKLDTLRLGMVIRISNDGGETFTIIGGALATNDNYEQGPFHWVIPDSLELADGSTVKTASDACIIKIHDYHASKLMDESDRMFRIRE